MVKSFAFLVATAEAQFNCTGTKDLVVSQPQCYYGSMDYDSTSAMFDVKIDDFGANGAGHMEVTGVDLAVAVPIHSFTCSNKVFTKSRLKITTDLSDCQSQFTIKDIEFCSDQDTVQLILTGIGLPMWAEISAKSVLCPPLDITV